jgi:hypothetical protein
VRTQPTSLKDPNEIVNVPYGNSIVFASKASGENAGSSAEFKHGNFTYYLLKAIQQTKGNITYRVLNDAIYNNLYNIDAGAGRRAFPVTISDDVEEWEDWQLSRP